MKKIIVSNAQARMIADALVLAQPHPCGHPNCKQMICRSQKAEREEYQHLLELVREAPYFIPKGE
jgi:hypothetical protein